MKFLSLGRVVDFLGQSARSPKPNTNSSAEPPSSVEPLSETDRGHLIKSLKGGSPIVLLHGRAGTGKTTLVRSLKTSGIRYVVVAPTGIAALNSGGQTIHSLFAIPPHIVNLQDIQPRQKLASILRNIDVLIIDEISMVRADIVDVIDTAMRVNLETQRPFGGKTLLMAGDFLQLPPIANRDDKAILEDRGYQVPYAFGAKSLRDISKIEVIELTTVYRQDEASFLELLDTLRTGKQLEEAVQHFNIRCHRDHRKDAVPIILTCRREAAANYNRRGLAALPSEATRFIGKVERDFRIEEGNLPAPEYLELKTGARVIMVNNDPMKRWVNGSLGTVSRLTDSAIWVKLDRSANDEEVHKVIWEKISYQYDPISKRVEPIVIGTYTQFPVSLAWAMTIHKAQGLTLEDVRIDLDHGAFSTGQTYVALSRAKTLDGLSLSRPLKTTDVISDTNIVESVGRISERGCFW